MSTSCPRHTITEPRQELREESAEAREARERLVREVREGTSPVDVEAADEVKYLGLIANYDEW